MKSHLRQVRHFVYLTMLVSKIGMAQPPSDSNCAPANLKDISAKPHLVQQLKQFGINIEAGNKTTMQMTGESRSIDAECYRNIKQCRMQEGQGQISFLAQDGKLSLELLGLRQAGIRQICADGQKLTFRGRLTISVPVIGLNAVSWPLELKLRQTENGKILSNLSFHENEYKMARTPWTPVAENSLVVEKSNYSIPPNNLSVLEKYWLQPIIKMISK